MTPFHAKYWAHLLTLKGSSGSVENLSRSIANSRVDLNPHQVEAALFALRSPLSRGAILADEVGLGKTIEAGIVLAQRWAERRRHILLIVPAILRKQWQQELREKFYLSTTVLDAKSYMQEKKNGRVNPFDRNDSLLVCSYQFAAGHADDIRQVSWDTVVIDEAHRLRNVYKTDAKTARRIADAIGPAPKLFLTATPLQNSLMELYGLVSLIDDHVFGDAGSFRDQFLRTDDEKGRNAQLRDRLKPLLSRTLRKQVVEYIPFTKRIPITQDFRPSDEEHALYESISAFLQREKLIALPASQRHLITLVLRKLLASSTFAVAATIANVTRRLERLGEQLQVVTDDDLEGIDELEDEIAEAAEDVEAGSESDVGDDDDGRIDPALLKEELAELRRFGALADSIKTNAKGEQLLPALAMALDKAVGLGAARKAVIFTESRRTQAYLFDLLSRNGYDGQLALINGSNTDANSQAIYEGWLKRHEGGEVITGSKAVDMKAAIVEEFRERATVLIATEAAAEGVNLQFCSLIVNYDLPWNPQRVEQRIGRCHRYGQKHDVVVLNFINTRNHADQRVYELLSEKFNLFSGVFGASDEVLGAIESGVDIERRIAAAYQTCRNEKEIKAAFDELQAELDEQIKKQMAMTRQALLENFDQDVAERLRINKDKTLESLNDRERWLLALSRIELDGRATFDSTQPRFEYRGVDAPTGHYHLDWKAAERLGDTFYRQDHPLAVRLIENAISRPAKPQTITFGYTSHGQVVSIVKPLVGQSGWLELSKLTVTSLDTEEFLLLSAQTDTGESLDEEVVCKMLLLPARIDGGISASTPDFTPVREQLVKSRLGEVSQRNAKFFDEEVEKLDRWSDDLKVGLERQIKDIDAAIKEARKTGALAATLSEKLEAQRQIKELEATRKNKRRDLFVEQDKVDHRRESLIGDIERQLSMTTSTSTVFKCAWRVQ
ncbi:MAG: SNF2-related protein [Tepidisphaeraceae bacterium]